MHWILQNNLFNERGYDALVGVFQRLDIPYSVHKVVPFVGELIPDPGKIKNPVICMGAYSMRRTAKKYNWYPGVFDLYEMNFLVQKDHWGSDMLNYESEVVVFKDIKFEGKKFLRPISDSKSFSGRVFDRDEFIEWQKKICEEEVDYGDGMTKDSLIQVMEPKEIYSEYRFFVVDGNVVTGSQYKVGNRVIASDNIDRDIGEAVAGFISKWQPAPAFVIDVCRTPDGIKIVEINTINAAGFYSCDVFKIVNALENLVAN